MLQQSSHKDFKNKTVTDKWKEVGKQCNCTGKIMFIVLLYSYIFELASIAKIINNIS